MDYLKTRAPFWKQIEFAGAAGDKTGGTVWVDAKQSDDALAERWMRAGTTRAAE
jgi:molybdopterin synthase catalytic subunit